MKKLLFITMFLASVSPAFAEEGAKPLEVRGLNPLREIKGRIVRNGQREAEINKYNTTYLVSFLGSPSWFSIHFSNQSELDKFKSTVISGFGEIQTVNVKTDKKKGNVDVKFSGETAQVLLSRSTGEEFISKLFTKEEAQQLLVY